MVGYCEPSQGNIIVEVFFYKMYWTTGYYFRESNRGVISTFSWGQIVLLIFQCHRTIEKLENSTLYVII